MLISSLIHGSHVDGPGYRSVIFMQGCSLRCRGCQSPHTHDPRGGQLIEDIPGFALRFINEAQGEQRTQQPLITISGGEPFDQAALTELLYYLRVFGAKHIILYTGRQWEKIQHHQALTYVDVVVDGPYIIEQDDIWLQYRGSRNQRVIDVPQSRTGKLVFLNWDRPELIITRDGNIKATAPIADMLQQWGMGSVRPTRRCGESRKT